MGGGASVAGVGAVGGSFTHYTGAKLTVNHTEQARFGGEKVVVEWLNAYALLVHPEDDYEVLLFVYSYIRDAFVCLVNKFKKGAMLAAYKDNELYRRKMGMFDSRPKVPRGKQTWGRFRGLCIPEITYNDPVIHGEHAIIQWLNPCCFRTEKEGKRAPELWIYEKATDSFLQVVVAESPIIEARTDPRRRHKRLTAAEIAKEDAAAKKGKGGGEEEGGFKEQKGDDDAVDNNGDKKGGAAAGEKRSRQVSAVEEVAADGCFEMVLGGRYTGPEGEVRVTHKAAKVFGKKRNITWLSPYTFTFCVEGGGGGDKTQVWVYSMEYQGFYQFTDQGDSIAQAYAGTLFYTRTEGEMEAELMMVEKQWGSFEGLTVPEEDEPVTFKGQQYSLDWLNPFAFHIVIEGQAFMQLGPWDKPASSMGEHEMKNLDPPPPPKKAAEKADDEDEERGGDGDDGDGGDEGEE